VQKLHAQVGDLRQQVADLRVIRTRCAPQTRDMSIKQRRRMNSETNSRYR
jgi:hypothetical protein